MKKILALLLALILVLSLAACGEKTTPTEAITEETTETEPEETIFKVGDTAQGQICNITIQSVEYVDNIKDGFCIDMWSPTTKTTYKDLTAEEGYSIVKISYVFDYTGKETGELKVGFTIDYDDGYTFDGLGGHALPEITNTPKVGFEEKYTTGAKNYYNIEDALAFKDEEAIYYIIVNDEVKENTDKSLVLKVDAPTSMWGYKSDEWEGTVLSEKTAPETFIFDIR